MIQRVPSSKATRWIALAMLLIAVAVSAVRLAHRPAASPVAALSGPSVSDPLQAALRRCQMLGEAGAHDAACRQAWADNRRRFFTVSGKARP